jgi:pilus assembly protein CpaC
MQGSKSFSRAALLLAAAVLPFGSVLAGVSTVGVDAGLLHAGQLDVPLNKSAVLKSDRAFTKAMVGNADIADVMPLTNKSLYVLGKRAGTTTLMLYQGNSLISVVDVTVGPDVVSLRRQLGELMPNEKVSVRVSNDSVVLSGVLSSAPAVERAMKIAATFAADKVVNMLSVGASQQVMLEVRFSEVSRSVGKQIGFSHDFTGNKVSGSIGGGGDAAITGAFGNGAVSYSLGSLQLFSQLDALERKGLVKTLAEPTLMALSGETASFLAGGEFPIPVSQGGSASTTGGGTTSSAITVEFKPFGVGLGFTPTVLDDGVINMVVEPEVSSIDSSASVTVNGLIVPGLQTRRAKTTVELRDGQSFAIAGLLRNDFNDTIRQMPILGSLPIIGALFRSTGFEKGETELVIIVTPRLVKPMRPEDVHLPTDRVGNPGELDLFLMGRTDKAIGVDPLNPNVPPPEKPTGAAKPPAPAAPTGAQPGMDGPVGHEI